MKKIMLATVAGVALLAVAPATAADLAVKAPRVAPVAPPPPAFSWTGCFVGAHWGWGWGRKDVTVARFESNGALSTVSGGIGGRAAGRIDTSGPIFGGQVGCDYQFGFGKGFGPGAWVIGIQGDVAGADINGFDQDPIAPDTASQLHVKQDWIASVTGRLGFTFPVQVLWYVRGGGAWTHDRWDLHASFLDFGTDFASQSRSGWTVGVGAEWAFAPNWSAFVEWNHYDFGNKDLLRFSDGDDFNAIDTKQRVETVKIGVNYRFNFLFGKGKAPVVARY